MSTDNSPQDPTADYRKYPKGPNFLTLVILFCVTIIVVLAIAVFVVGRKGKNLTPHPPAPTPNSLVQPYLPDGAAALLS